MEHTREGRLLAATDHGGERTTQDHRPNGQDDPLPKVPNQPHGSTELAPRLDPDEAWMIVPLRGPHVVSGWTLTGGDMIGADRVVWRLTQPGQPPLESDPKTWLREQLAARFNGRVDLPAFISSRALSCFQEARVEETSSTDSKRPHAVRALATVNLTGALAAGDSKSDSNSDSKFTAGAIQVLILCDRPLSSEARLEALCIATEAKVLALLDVGVVSATSGQPATGAGGDRLLVAAPTGTGPRERHLVNHAGKHTAIGAAIGVATREAVAAGARAWLEAAAERAKKPSSRPAV